MESIDARYTVVRAGEAGLDMQFNVNGKIIETDEQGFLRDLGDWNEDFARALARRDGVELYVDHWELIWYFRDYYKETQSLPTMRKMVCEQIACCS